MPRLIAFLPRFTAGAALTVALVLAPTVLPSGGDKVEARTKTPVVRDHRTPPKWTPNLPKKKRFGLEVRDHRTAPTWRPRKK